MSSTAEEGTQEKVVPGTRRRLVRFLFCPPPLGPLPTRAGRFAERLAKSPPDLVTHLGMVRANAYHAAGCPLALCDHAAARDIWNVIHEDAITKEERWH